MKKGINCWCFPAEFSIQRCLQVARKAGFDGVEINMEEESINNQLKLTLDSSEEQILEIQRLADELGIELPSISTSLFWKYSLTDNDPGVRNFAKEIVRKMIDVASLLDIDTILVVPGQVNMHVSYIEAYERSLQAFEELKSYAETKEVSIGVENVWNKFLLSPIEMKNFIDKIDSPFVGAYFDVGNVLYNSYPEYWIEILATRIKKVHVKDFKTEAGNVHGFTHLLAGDVNWQKVMASLREVGYDEYLTAELSPYKFYPEKIAADTVNALEGILEL